MVRRHLMISVVDKQRRLLDKLVDQLGAATEDEIQDSSYFARQAEQIAMNLREWAAVQQQYRRSQLEVQTAESLKGRPFFSSQNLF